jgi:two-component system, chemotaxis family, chemotaxis protein CheY
MPIDVLIVDDSPVMRLFVKRTLTMSGLDLGEVLEAGNGQEAMQLLAGRSIDVILTDINMPRMDGVTLIRQLKTHQALRNIPTLILSTDSSKERIETIRLIGANGYLSKPFQPETLEREVRRVLGGAIAQR